MRGRFVFSVFPFEQEGGLGCSSELPLARKFFRSPGQPDFVARRFFRAMVSWFPLGRGAVSEIRIIFLRIESAARTIGGAGSYF